MVVDLGGTGLGHDRLDSEHTFTYVGLCFEWVCGFNTRAAVWFVVIDDRSGFGSSMFEGVDWEKNAPAGKGRTNSKGIS